MSGWETNSEFRGQMQKELSYNDGGHSTTKKRSDQLSLSLESALLHLQPIRDLAQNWDVDIASCLEEVLKDLAPNAHLTDDQVNSESTIMASGNFSQAAILLQNAGFVYSRKVEYLYNLVLSTVKDLHKDNDKADRKKSSDTSLDEFDSFDPDMQFLLLDDVLPTVDKASCINLKENDSDFVSLNKMNGQPTPSNVVNNQTYLSLGMTGSRLAEQVSSSHSPLLAESSIPKNDKVRMANIVRETVAQGSNGSYVLRLVSSMCNLDPKSGALLIPGSNLLCATATTATTTAANDLGNDHFHNDDHDNDYDLPIHYEHHSIANESFTNDAVFNSPQTTVNVNSNQQKTNVAFQHSSVDRHTTTAESYKGEHKKEIPPDARDDPLTRLLNPQDPGSIKPRPLKTGGITYKLPNAAALDSRDKYNFISYVPDQINLCENTGKIMFLRKQSCVDPPLLGLAYGNEFAYIEKKNRRNQRLTDRRNKPTTAKRDPVLDNGIVDDDNNEQFGFHDDGDEDNDSVHNVEDCNVQAELFDNCDIVSNRGELILSELRQHKTFEELCREHIKELAKKAEKYAAETQLSKRVGLWQSQIIPVLADEEKRPDFEIHSHGRSIIEQLVQEQKKTDRNKFDFQLLVKDCEPYGVCRSFISALMLCNTENVLLKNSAQGGLVVELLNAEYNVAIGSYDASSA
jgi:condensin-2 complex subunit H2